MCKPLLVLLFAAALKQPEAKPERHCYLEPGARHYPSHWNQTALRVCKGAPQTERVCILGGGPSGVHLAYLLKRRLFTNVTVFEKNARLGGDVWTRPPSHGPGGLNISRELGAAFLSPDYFEVRALLRRFGQTEVPLSTHTELEFHVSSGGAERVLSASSWAGERVSRYTNSTNATHNAQAVSAALGRYIELHRYIFGEYEGRFPPEPRSASQLEMLNATSLKFLEAHDLLVLEPLMYQFFVLQGMGLLTTMPAYYLLKWASPESLGAGGFGDHSDEPLAMLPDGYGALVDSMAREATVDVRFGWRAVRVTRGEAHATIHFEEPESHPPQKCDLLVLSGPIPEFISGSLDGTRSPILSPATTAEAKLFGAMRPMQFLISLVEFTSTPKYQTLEYWPDAFEVASEVIVRRDVGYAESGAAHQSHPVGGLQSYSYWPVPTANRSTHWAAQRRWAAAHGLQIKRVVAQNYIDTYLFHHSAEEVAGPTRKPWRLGRLQLADGLCNCTLYVGGAASYEAVEDVLQYNLQLVSEHFDATLPLEPPPSPPAHTHTAVAIATHAAQPEWRGEPPLAFVLETLRSTLACSNVERFIAADASVWTAFLRWQPGYVRKTVSVLSPAATPASCEVWDQVEWYSRELWKAIPAAQLEETSKRFDEAYGGKAPAPQPTPADATGLSIISRVERRRPFAPGQVYEHLTFDGVACGGGVAAFLAADNTTYTAFLQAQPGFVARELLAHQAETDELERGADGASAARCTVVTRTRWQDLAAYEAVCASGPAAAACARVHSAFVAKLGYDPPMQRWPMPTARSDESASYGPRVAVLAGTDLVAYHSLQPGEHDVRGSPAHRRWLNTSLVLPPELRSFHPLPYEFWFSSEPNARAFEANPYRYLPAFGGHCTHGIASRGDLNRSLLADGRMAFTCVNGTRWAVLNGVLYMNSCGMYPDFIKQPQKDAATAHARWHEWFGGWIGPINDACVQDEGEWGGDPVGGLIPRECVLA